MVCHIDPREPFLPLQYLEFVSCSSIVTATSRSAASLRSSFWAAVALRSSWNTTQKLLNKQLLQGANKTCLTTLFYSDRHSRTRACIVTVYSNDTFSALKQDRLFKGITCTYHVPCLPTSGYSRVSKVSHASPL